MGILGREIHCAAHLFLRGNHDFAGFLLCFLLDEPAMLKEGHVLKFALPTSLSKTVHAPNHLLDGFINLRVVHFGWVFDQTTKRDCEVSLGMQ